MEIEITNYSCYDNGIVSKTENVSNITDKMIRLSAKLTERFARDIVFSINDLEDAITEKRRVDDLLFFRENGVNVIKANDLTVDRYNSFLGCFTPIQIWRLTHNPDTTETKLIRIHIRKVGLI